MIHQEDDLDSAGDSWINENKLESYFWPKLLLNGTVKAYKENKHKKLVCVVPCLLGKIQERHLRQKKIDFPDNIN